MRPILRCQILNPEGAEDSRRLRQLPISKQWLDGLKFSNRLPECFAMTAARGLIRVSEDVPRMICI